MRSLRLTVLALLIFTGCFVIGLGKAAQRPLWNDEIYSQLSSVEKLSYLNILQGKIREGNVSPLFYIIQKGVSGLFNYEPPEIWETGRTGWVTRDPRGEWILRLSPDIFMSLGIVFIFLFFSMNFSLLAGFYSLLTALTSFMVWAYWADARPYALWFCLTMAQALCFLTLVRSEKSTLAVWRSLVVVNILLALSVVFSLLQITAVSLLLWLNGKKEWKRYIWLFVLPCCIVIYYYLHTPKYDFWFKEGPLGLVSASIPKERLALVGIYAFVLAGFYLRPKKFSPQAFSCEGRWFLLFSLLMLLAAGVILAIFKYNEKGVGVGFQISNRYFMYLAPVGIITTTLFSIDLLNAFRKNVWIKAIILILLSGMLLLRITKVWGTVLG